MFPTVLGVGFCINVHNLIIYWYSTRYYRKLKTYGLKNFLLHVSLLTLSICITSIFVLIQTINNSIFFLLTGLFTFNHRDYFSTMHIFHIRSKFNLSGNRVIIIFLICYKSSP